MNCNEIKDMISLYIDDELEDEEKLLFDRHIENCEHCRKELDEYRKMVNMLQNLPEEEPPKGYCKRLHEKLLNVKLNNKTSMRSRWIKYSSIAATFVLIISAIYIANMSGSFKRSMDERSVAYEENQTAEQKPEAPAEMKFAGGAPDTSVKTKSFANTSTMDAAQSNNNYGITVAPVENTDKEMKIIRSGYIVAQTESYDTFINDLMIKINSLGGYLEQNNTSVRNIYEDKELKYGNLVIRIPQDSFYEFISFLESSSKVNQKNITETDVTKDYYEKDNQVKNLELQETHLRELFDKAKTVEEMLLIENELKRVRTEIDALKISLSDIDDRSSMSTVTLDVEEVLKANLAISHGDSVWERARDGFINTVNSILKFGENLIIWMISISPLLLPVLIVVAIIIFIRRKKMKNNK